MKKIRSNWLAALLCSAWIPVACSGGGNVNIGNTQAVGSQLSDYAASWDGYAEAYTFSPSGSDRVRLTIDTNGQGTLQVGDGTLLPPPTDPSVGYPPGLTLDNYSSDLALTEGFLYPIYAAQVGTDRIQLGANPADLFGAWCAIETPFGYQETTVTTGRTDGGLDGGLTATTPGASDGGTVYTFYSCLPNWGYTAGTAGCSIPDPDGQNDPVDCGKLMLCDMLDVCECTATSCATPHVPAGTPVAQYPVELDAALDSTGATLTGTLVLSGTRVTVLMQRK